MSLSFPATERGTNLKNRWVPAPLPPILRPFPAYALSIGVWRHRPGLNENEDLDPVELRHGFLTVPARES